MARVWGFDEVTAQKLKRQADQPEVVGEAFTQRLNRPQFVGGSKVKRYRFLGDMFGNGPVYAREVNRSNTFVDGSEPILFYGVDSLLSGARAGYICPGEFDANGDLVAMITACVNSCATSGTITTSAPPTGTVGTSYSHSVTRSGLSPNTVSATGLPPGLSINGSTGAITGTPTTAGRYIVIVTGTAAKTGGGTCTITLDFAITINEAA